MNACRFVYDKAYQSVVIQCMLLADKITNVSLGVW